MKFREFLKEGIIFPNIPKMPIIKDFNSLSLENLQEVFPSIIFYRNTKDKLGASYNPRNKELKVNLENVNTFIFHESIHKIQDELSNNLFWEYIINKRVPLIGKHLKEKIPIFNVTNKFEEMAYASTFTLFFINLDLSIEEGIKYYKRDLKYKKLFNTLLKGNLFKKYLYLYYKKLITSNLTDINEVQKQYKILVPKNKIEYLEFINELL